MDKKPYIGRFAPSPTGPLHFGSLICALGSYLDAHHNAGRWLVRIEDIDPPREVPGATTTILHQLEDHGLVWQGDLLYQSARLPAYRDALEQLQAAGLTYHCDCTRQRIVSLGSIYDGHCRHRQLSAQGAIRLLTPAADCAHASLRFNDLVMGDYQQNLATQVGDFVLQRRDGLFSYQLAVTVDDLFQNITHVVRGADLLDSTPRQLYLRQLYSRECLALPVAQSAAPQFAHLPLATNAEGQKLSKQNFAKPLLKGDEANNLWQALLWLRQSPPRELQLCSVQELLDWAIPHWQLAAVPKQLNLPAPSSY